VNVRISASFSPSNLLSVLLSFANLGAQGPQPTTTTTTTTTLTTTTTHPTTTELQPPTPPTHPELRDIPLHSSSLLSEFDQNDRRQLRSSPQASSSIFYTFRALAASFSSSGEDGRSTHDFSNYTFHNIVAILLRSPSFLQLPLRLLNHRTGPHSFQYAFNTI
jgi:hypothetical protein